MAWMHELKLQKIIGLYHKWLLLHAKEEFLEIVKFCDEANVEGRPDPPARFPCMAWFFDAGPSECGMFPSAIYFYLFEARELVEVQGFEVKKKPVNEVEW